MHAVVTEADPPSPTIPTAAILTSAAASYGASLAGEIRGGAHQAAGGGVALAEVASALQQLRDAPSDYRTSKQQRRSPALVDMMVRETRLSEEQLNALNVALLYHTPSGQLAPLLNKV